MALNLTDIGEGVFYAQYIGWDPAMQVFRDRPNNSLVRVQVIKGDDGGLLVSLPHLQSPSPLNPIRLESAIKEWRFVRRVRMSSRMIPIRPRASSSGRTLPVEQENSEAVSTSSTSGDTGPGAGS